MLGSLADRGLTGHYLAGVMPGETGYYEKHPAAAERYDALHADQREDVAFYVEEARRAGGPVLEAGCGTGRVALAIAAAGVPVVGLDRSASMLEVAEAKRRRAAREVRTRVVFLRADMRAYAFRRGFARVLVPFRGFQAMITVADQLAALAAAGAALAPGGRLVFDVFDPRHDLLATGLDGPTPLAETGRAYRDAGGDRVVEKFATRYDPLRQVLETTFVYERVGAEGVVVERSFEPLRLRYLFRYEIEHLLARTGYEVEAVYGGWERRPPERHGQDLVWIARRRSSA